MAQAAPPPWWIFEIRHTAGRPIRGGLGTRPLLEPLLRDADLPTHFADALDDDAFDDEIRAETEEALTLTGRDVGTPILHFRPPGGTALFGPVITRLPRPDDAVRLWDHVITLADFPGFAELKRSLRKRPPIGQLRRRHRNGWYRRGLARRQPTTLIA